MARKFNKLFPVHSNISSVSVLHSVGGWSGGCLRCGTNQSERAMLETAVRKHKVLFQQRAWKCFSSSQPPNPRPPQPLSAFTFLLGFSLNVSFPFSSPFMLFIHLAMDFHWFFPRRKIYSSQKQHQQQQQHNQQRRRGFAPEQTERKLC